MNKIKTYKPIDHSKRLIRLVLDQGLNTALSHCFVWANTPIEVSDKWAFYRSHTNELLDEESKSYLRWLLKNSELSPNSGRYSRYDLPGNFIVGQSLEEELAYLTRNSYATF